MRTSLSLLIACTFVFPAAAQDGPPPPDAPPSEAPAEKRGLKLRAEGAFDGYTLFTPLRGKSTYLVNMAGEKVHEWKHETSPGNSVYLLDNGELLRCARVQDAPVFSGGGQGGRLQKFDWDGNVLWDWQLASEENLHHHDIEPLPSGNILVIAWEHKTAELAIAAGRDPEKVGEAGFWPDVIFEIQPVGTDQAKRVWEWHSWDHVAQDTDRKLSGYMNVAEHPARIDINADHRSEPPMTEASRLRQAELDSQMRAAGYTGGDEDDEEEEEEEEEADGDRRGGRGGDWLHTNSIDYHAGLDLILLSARTMSEIWVIDHSTTTEEAAGHTGGKHGKGGDLLYRWGNPKTYGAGDDSDRQLWVQHDARFIEAEGPLSVMVFNNGEGRSSGGGYSSVDEIELPLDGDGRFVRVGEEAFGPKKPSWSYTAENKQDFFSSFISGADRLPNGNTLICSGSTGRLFEVTTGGEIVWEYLNPFGGEDADEEAQDGPDGRRGPPPGQGPEGRPEGPPDGEGPGGRRGPPPGEGGRRGPPPGDGRGGRGGPPGGGRRSGLACFRVGVARSELRHSARNPPLLQLSRSRDGAWARVLVSARRKRP